LEGSVFLGDPACAPCAPADAQAGRLLRLLVEARGDGATIKLEGALWIDQTTDQTHVTLADLPELPLGEIRLTLDGARLDGSPALLVNPPSCGEGGLLHASAALTPWSAPATPLAEPSVSLALSGCAPAPFAPALLAGTTNNEAGATSPLTLDLSRPGADTEASLGVLALQMPPGLLPLLYGIPPCGEPTASQGACPAASLLGSVTLGLGPGPNPLYLSGRVYLTGPHAGAPFGLALVLPASPGPLDLGALVLRAALSIDPRTARLTIAGDPLPASLDGIPLRPRSLHIDLDRAGLLVNPTDCAPLTLDATLTPQPAQAPLARSVPFQAADCAALSFAPRLTASTRLTAPARARAPVAGTSGVPLRLSLRFGHPSHANLRALTLTLPGALRTRARTLRAACPRARFDADPARCPAGARIGGASLSTPLLGAPLRGALYLLAPAPRHVPHAHGRRRVGASGPPEILALLHAQGVTLELAGALDLAHGRPGSFVFSSLPDLPLGSLTLSLSAGSRSLLLARSPGTGPGGLCRSAPGLSWSARGWNGAHAGGRTVILVDGCTHTHA
jgi:hypothetical protein